MIGDTRVRVRAGCAALTLAAFVLVVLAWATGVPMPWTLRAEGRARAEQCETARALASSITTLPPRDANPTQNPTAAALGVAPLDDEAAFQASGHIEAQRLVRVVHSAGIRVGNMTHSLPYLVPAARDLVAEIGARLQKRATGAGLPLPSVRLTSALRTTESQRNLRKVNRQATRGPSAHWHGTTFDLGYRPEHWRLADAPGHAWLARNRRVAYLYRKLGPFGAPARAATNHDTCIKTAMRTVLRDELVHMRTEGLLWALEESDGAFHVTVRQGVSRSASLR